METKPKTFVSDKIARIVKRHVPNDGINLTIELTELFTQLLVQASGTAIQMYIEQGIKSEGS